MSNSKASGYLEVLLKEYEKLKDEQIQRVSFRDNIIYIMLVLVGSVGSFALSQSDKNFALLIIPWICLILGWTYLVNDEKISSIGKYIRTNLTESIRTQLKTSGKIIFGWEVEHRSDSERLQRKISQVLIDELTFVISGIAAVFVYLFLQQPISWVLVICIGEIIFLCILGIEIIKYADFKQGRR